MFAGSCPPGRKLYYPRQVRHVRFALRIVMVLLCSSLETPAARERVWQTGEIDNIYGEFDPGTRSPRADTSRSRSQGPAGVQTVRRFIDIRAGHKIYTIQHTIFASSLRSTPGERPSPEVFVDGAAVKFAVEGKSLIVLGPDGKERKFRIRKEGVF